MGLLRGLKLLKITSFSGVEVASDDAVNVLNLNIPNSFKLQADDFNSFESYTYKDELQSIQMSYSTYNDWREILAQAAGYPLMSYKDMKHSEVVKHSHCAGAWEATAGPFWELINFSDCEGIIGTQTSKKLAKDFKMQKARVFKSIDNSAKTESQIKLVKAIYEDIEKVFNFASNDGLVAYH